LVQGHEVSRSLALFFTQKAKQGVRYDSEALFCLTIVDSFGQKWATERRGSGLGADGGKVRLI
jgi:hypothetical protein